jgi:hypothetical protein
MAMIDRQKVTPATCTKCGKPTHCASEDGLGIGCCYVGKPIEEEAIEPPPTGFDAAIETLQSDPVGYTRLASKIIEVLDHYADPATWSRSGGPRQGKYYMGTGDGAGPARRLLRELRGDSE